MPEYVFDVEYTSRGTMIVEAENEEDAKLKAKIFDCIDDEVIESDFEDVDLYSCKLNE